MRRVKVLFQDQEAGILEEHSFNLYKFIYDSDYRGDPISLTLPVTGKEYAFDCFPSFFDGLLPEGVMLDGLLRQTKIDKYDYFSQLIAVGRDMVGAVTVEVLK